MSFFSSNYTIPDCEFEILVRFTNAKPFSIFVDLRSPSMIAHTIDADVVMCHIDVNVPITKRAEKYRKTYALSGVNAYVRDPQGPHKCKQHTCVYHASFVS